MEFGIGVGVLILLGVIFISPAIVLGIILCCASHPVLGGIIIVLGVLDAIS